jgi:ABC-type lipoprotein release transport system permease subunit
MAVWAAGALLFTAFVAALYPAAKAARVPPADTLSGL